MKILMTVTMAMLVSVSLYAGDCREGEKCSADDCAKLGKDFSLNEAKLCVKVGASQASSTACAGMVDNGRAEKPTGDTTTTGEKSATAVK